MITNLPDDIAVRIAIEEQKEVLRTGFSDPLGIAAQAIANAQAYQGDSFLASQSFQKGLESNLDRKLGKAP